MKLKERMAVHCDTREKAIKFLKECERQGITTCAGNHATRLDKLNVWDDNKIDTCYGIYFKEGTRQLILGFSSIKYYLSIGYKVIEFDDLFKEEKKMSKCKIYEIPDYVRSEIKKVIVNNRTVVVILSSGHKGVATCSPEDKFIESVGYQIALLRARINKNEDGLKEKKDILDSITNNPKLIENVNIL